MKRYFVLLVAAAFSASPAFASSVSTWEEAPNFGEPSFTGFTTWALRVETDTDWLLSELEVQLTSGALNHIRAGLANQPLPFLTNLGDSGVFNPTVPHDVASLGNNLAGGGLFASEQPPFRESPTNLAVGWANTRNTDIGVFHIATLTLSDDANGTIRGRVITNAAGNNVAVEPLEFRIVNGVIGVPEPSTLALMSLGVVVFLGCRSH